MEKPPMSMRALRRVHKMGSEEAWHEYNRRGMRGRPKREQPTNFNRFQFKTWLKERKFTYRKIAERLNLSVPTIANWVSGKYALPETLLESLHHIDIMDFAHTSLPPLTPAREEEPKSDLANPIKFDPFKNNFK